MARKIQVEIVGDSRSLERAFGRSERAGRGFGRSMSGLGRSIGRGLAVGVAAVGAAGAALGGISAKVFAPFEESLDRIKGLTNATAKETEKWGKIILKLGPAVGKGPQELADAMFFIASAGITGKRALDALTASAKASASGLGETKVVADVVTSALNAYQSTGLTAARVTDVLSAAVREGKAEASAFAPVIGNLLPTASALHISFDKVVGTLALFSKTGTDAAEGATSIQAIMSSLLSTSPKVVKALASVGLTQKQLRDIAAGPGGLVAVFRKLDEAFGGDIEKLRQVFPNVRAFRGVMNALAQDAGSVDSVLRGVTNSTGDAAHAFKSITEGEAFKFHQALASIQAIGIKLGSAFAPAVKLAADGAGRVLDVINDLIDNITAKRTIVGKLNVVWQGAENAAKGAASILGKAVGAIDWDEVWSHATKIADGLQAQLEQVDFSVVGRRIGDAFSDAASVAFPKAKEIVDRLLQAVRTIPWETVGKEMGPGLAAAVATAFATLVDPSFWLRNWDVALAIAVTVFGGSITKVAGKLAAPLARLGGDMVLAIGVGLERAFPRLAAVLLKALERLPGLVARVLSPLTGVASRIFARLGRLGRFTVKVLGIQAAINQIVALGRRVGGVFSDLAAKIRDSFLQQWARLVNDARKAALLIIEPFTHIPRKLGGGVFQDAKKAIQADMAAAAKTADEKSKAINASLLSIKDRHVNVVVDTQIKGDFTSVPGATGAGTSFADAVGGAFALVKGKLDAAIKAGQKTGTATVDAATKAKNAAKLAAKRAAKEAKERRTAFEKAIDSITLQIDRDIAGKKFDRALADNTKLQAAIKKQIAAEGKTTELTRQLFQAEQDRIGIVTSKREAAAAAATKATAKAQAAQFKLLGLTGQGEARTPGVANLTKQLEQITTRLGKDASPKIRAQLAAIGRVLALGTDKVKLETRKKIVEMFGDIRSTFDKEASKGPTTRSVQISDKILAALGFDKNFDVGRLRGVGNAANTFRAAAVSTGSLAAAGQVTFTGDITVVANNPQEFLGQLQKKAGRTSGTARGRFPGRNLGLG